MQAEQRKMQVIASIVLYNHSHSDIEPTLKSLLAEKVIGKIVLVDNGGCSWASQLKNDRIDYILAEKNKGFGAGQNLAMAQYLPCCEYFLICNPDVYFEQGVVDELVVFSRTSNHHFVSPLIIYPEGRQQYSCRLLPTPANLFLRRFIPKLAKSLDKDYELQEADYRKAFPVPTVSGCFMLIRSDILEKLKGFDERYFMYMEDIDLCRRALAFTSIIYYPKKTITHLFNKGSYKSKYLLMQHILSSIKYFNKWGWFLDKERRGLNSEYLRKIPKLLDKSDV